MGGVSRPGRAALTPSQARVALPLLSLTLTPRTTDDRERLAYGLRTLIAEDPTLHVTTDPVTGTSALGGVGELHLEIALDRLKREFGASASVSTPQIVYKESRFAQMAVLLEPIMRVEVITPRVFLDAVIADLGQRRGRVTAIHERDGMQIVHSNVPLARLFGYGASLRDCARGRASFTMTLRGYEPVDPPWS
jgi:translation elongation factor EF-G